MAFDPDKFEQMKRGGSGGFDPSKLAALKTESPSRLSGLANLFGAIVEPPLQMLTGAVAKPVSEIGGLGAMVAPTLYSGQNPEQVRQSLQETGTYQPRTQWGKAVAESPYHPINALGRGVGYVSGKVHEVVGGGEDATTNRGQAANAIREAINQAVAIALLKAPAPVQRGLGNAALLGAPLVYDAVKGVGRGIVNLAEPHLPGGTRRVAGRTMNQAAGAAQPSVVRELQQAVPGQTAGQAATPAGSPEFAALQALSEKLQPRPYDVMEQVQKSKRAATLNQLAGGATDEARAVTRQGLVGSRAASTKPLFDVVERSQAPVQVKPILTAINEIIAKNINEDAVTGPLRAIRADLVGNAPKAGFSPIKQGATTRQLESNPQALASTSKNIKNMIEAKNVDGKPQYNVAVLKQVKDMLDTAIGEAEPAYKAARDEYARKSIPINRLDVGGKLADTLLKPTGKESPAPYLSAADDAAKTLLKSTGQSRYKGFKDLFNPQHVKAIEGITKELQTNLRHQELARKGGPAVKTTIEDTMGELSWPGLLHRPIMAAHYLASRLQGHAAGKSMAELATIMQDPKVAAQVMMNTTLTVPQRIALRDAIRQGLGQGMAASLPTRNQP